MRIKKSIPSLCFIFLLAFGLFGCSSKDTEKNDDLISAQNTELIYEDTISPNEDYVKNKEDIVYYTVKIYQNKDNHTVLVNSTSNSPFFEPLQYELELDTDITQSDVHVKWTTVMGNPKPSKDDQLSIAYVSVSENGNLLSERKISFINRGIEIIEDGIQK